jgi:hypothetical protein
MFFLPCLQSHLRLGLNQGGSLLYGLFPNCCKVVGIVIIVYFVLVKLVLDDLVDKTVSDALLHGHFQGLVVLLDEIVILKVILFSSFLGGNQQEHG